jgi:peptidoglycan/xylan/chitin deacetylase (PgdA/CDA1 family)
MESNGSLLISLDFELFWGVHDKEEITHYGDAIEEVWDVLPEMISIFDQHDVKCTFATVGFLFANQEKELKSYFPEKKPNYSQKSFSPYRHFNNLNPNPRYYFASELLDLIQQSDKHEIATHTFSHYYCLEDGQKMEEFEEEIKAAISIASRKKVVLKSIVFPRNQVNKNYIPILEKNGITSYRGTEKSWFYAAEKGSKESLFKRFFRLFDSYINISGHNTYSIKKEDTMPYNFPSSRFLRPYNPKLRLFESFRLKRILNGMEYAAKNNEVFHLWWHPHNFGRNQKENFKILKVLLEHFSSLKKLYNFESLTMEELASKIKF